jgi:ribonuclease E
MEEEAMKEMTGKVIAQVPVTIASFLLNEKRQAVADIQARRKIELVVVPNPYLDTPHYEISRVRSDELDEHDIASYKHIQRPSVSEDTSHVDPQNGQVAPEAAVTNVMPNKPAPQQTARVVSEDSSLGKALRFVRRLYNSVFVSLTDVPPATTKASPPKAERTSNGKANTERRNQERRERDIKTYETDDEDDDRREVEVEQDYRQVRRQTRERDNTQDTRNETRNERQERNGERTERNERNNNGNERQERNNRRNETRQERNNNERPERNERNNNGNEREPRQNNRERNQANDTNRNERPERNHEREPRQNNRERHDKQAERNERQNAQQDKRANVEEKVEITALMMPVTEPTTEPFVLHLDPPVVQTNAKPARGEKVVEAEAVVEIEVIPTTEVAPTAVYETEILATLANADMLATPTPEASLVVEPELNATVQSETLLVTPEATEAVQAQNEAVKVVGEAFETAIPVLAEVDAVAVNAADDSAALAEANVSTDTAESEIVSSERPAREYRDRRGRTRRSRNGNNERNERPPRNANNGNEASAFQPAVDLEPLVIELTNSQLVDIAPVPVVVVVEPEAAVLEEAFTVEPVVTKRNPKVVEQPDGDSQASVAQPEDQAHDTLVMVGHVATEVVESESAVSKADYVPDVTETVLDLTAPTIEPQAQMPDVAAASEQPKPNDTLEVKILPKKRPIWMHVDPTEADKDKAEQV